jgi:hypothetical protein
LTGFNALENWRKWKSQIAYIYFSTSSTLWHRQTAGETRSKVESGNYWRYLAWLRLVAYFHTIAINIVPMFTVCMTI